MKKIEIGGELLSPIKELKLKSKYRDIFQMETAERIVGNKSVADDYFLTRDWKSNEFLLYKIDEEDKGFCYVMNKEDDILYITYCSLFKDK